MDSTAPKPFVFVLMPFDSEFKDVYKLGIKPACTNAGAYAERVDEQIFTESILERIYNQIAKADILVADMTGRNPNVFYETGYAHALGKIVILLTKDSTDIPFDLKHYPHIVYGGEIADKLLPELEKKIIWAIANTQQRAQKNIQNIQYSIYDSPLENNPLFHVTIESLYAKHQKYMGNFNMLLEIYNDPEQTIKSNSLEISFVIPENIVMQGCRIQNDETKAQIIVRADGKRIYQLQKMINLLPGTHEIISTSFHINFGIFTDGIEAINSFPKIYQFALLEHSANDYRELLFSIHMNFLLKPDHSNLRVYDDKE